MDVASIINLIIGLVSGGVGGNVAGAALKDKSLGTTWNTIIGIIGGAGGKALLGALGLAGGTAAAAGGLDITSILKEIATNGVSGGVVVAIIGLIKNALNKS